MKASKMFHLLQGHSMKIKTTSAFQVNFYKAGTNSWIFRLDKPHTGAMYNHININPKYSGLVKDPHFYLPPGSLHVSSTLLSFHAIHLNT
jgi:hypothetical protein